MLRLEALGGLARGKTFAVAGDECVIGRGGDGQVVLEDVAVSTRHAGSVLGLGDAVFDLVPQATHVTVVLQDEAGKGPPNYLPALTRARPKKDAPAAAEFVPITRSVYQKVLRERAAVLAADAPQIIGQTASIM